MMDTSAIVYLINDKKTTWVINNLKHFKQKNNHFKGKNKNHKNTTDIFIYKFRGIKYPTEPLSIYLMTTNFCVTDSSTLYQHSYLNTSKYIILTLKTGQPVPPD